MTLNLIIRKAVIEDVPSFLPLMDQLGYPQPLEILKAQFEIFSKQEGYEIFLADKAGTIIGWVAWSKSYLFVTPTTRIHIEGLVVDKKFRGQDIGRKLMKKVEEVAQQLSPCIVDLTSG
ncbi:GNAT family N-acetyltransferase [Legionella sp. CNM-1927-20]|uniref:GNAT family N-acetyltransferase n=1 Tax=Legionella sp. CNM-1927-20 TaxID=3422221 RepID=UPI00403B1E95